MDTHHAADYGPITINCPETVRATEYYSSLVRFSPPGTLDFTWDEQLAALQAGHVAIAIVWSDEMSALEDHAQSQVAGKLGYGVLPEFNDQSAPPS